MKKSVLFISHDAFRAGATIILINFLRWFKKNTDIPFHVLICNRGEMETETRVNDNAGGGREFVEEDASCVVPYLDIGAASLRWNAFEAVSAMGFCGTLGPDIVRYIASKCAASG
jgi:hypothetical protein